MRARDLKYCRERGDFIINAECQLCFRQRDEDMKRKYLEWYECRSDNIKSLYSVNHEIGKQFGGCRSSELYKTLISDYEEEHPQPEALTLRAFVRARMCNRLVWGWNHVTLWGIPVRKYRRRVGYGKRPSFNDKSRGIERSTTLSN